MPRAEPIPDQAAGLSQMAQPKAVRVIAVTSGKGGVGKTNVSANLAIAMALEGKEVMLMDADLGLGNVDVLLGLQPTHNLFHVVNGQCSLEEVIVTGPADIKIVPATSGTRCMTNLTMAEHAGLIRAFSDLGLSPDTLLIDTAAGITDHVVSFSKASQEIVVVVCNEPASITDAYALIKLMHREHGRDHFRILANMARSTSEGRELFLKLLKVTDRFLSVSLDYMGAIPLDECMHKAVKQQRAVVEAFPRSKAALAFKKLATVADKWSAPNLASGRLEFFVERLIQAEHGVVGAQR